MNELVKVENNQIVVSSEFIKKYRDFKKLQLEMDLMEKEVKEKLKLALEETGKGNYIVDGFSAVIRKGSTRTSLDTARIKKERPEIYEEYSKTSEIPSSIVITVE